MNTMKTTIRPLAALLAAGLALTSASAALAGSPAMTGLVGEADTAESAFTAPAALTRLDGTHITVQTMVATSFSNFDVDESKTEVGGGDPNLGHDPVIIPSLYYTRQLNDRWYSGLSLTIPSGFGSDYGGQWAGRYNTVDFSLVYVALTPTVAYRVNDKLSLGLGVGINYTSETSEVKIRQPFKEGDGKISSDLDAVAFNVSVSMFYEFTERTRAGIAWTSDTDSDLEGNVRLRKLDPVFDEIATELGIKNINVELTNTLPQRVLAGMYHEFESGNFFTVDGMWMNFSDFTVSDIKLDGNKVHVSAPSIYNDLWALTVGAGFPVNERMTYKVGAMYLSQGVDDDKRTFSIPLDEIWGAGVGLTYSLPEERSLDLNTTLFYTGKSPIDTGNGEPGLGRVEGENDDPYAILFELTYHL
jgi:long-chain fatty acid transport protein